MYAVTGATGHLGQSILRQAANSGIGIRAIVRSSSNRRLLEGLCDDIIDAPLDDAEALTRAVTGCDVVIHAAAMIDIRRGRKAAMSRVNVRGTANILEACRQAGVKRLVYVSSIEAIDMKNPLRPITEEHGFANGDAVMEYGDTKAEASRLISEAGRAAAAGGHGPECVSICPTAITGPWDYQDGLLTTMFRRYTAGGIPVTIPGGFDYVDVREVAGAVLAAAAGQGRSGEAYLTAGAYLSVRELLKVIDDITGRKRVIPALPLPLAQLAGWFSETWSRMTGRSALFTKGSIDILQTDARIRTAKAEKELGFCVRPTADTIRDTINWLQRGLDPDSSPASETQAKKSAAG